MCSDHKTGYKSAAVRRELRVQITRLVISLLLFGRIYVF